MSQLVYLACPYSHPSPLVRQVRFDAVNKAAAALMRAGVLIFSPISHTHPIALAGSLPLGFDFWEQYDFEYLCVCKAIIVLELEGWATSKGVQSELKIMRELSRPVFSLRPGEPVGDIAERLRGI